MSLFKKQLTAAREARVEVDLQTEGSVATESLGNEGVEEDITQEIDIDAIVDQFAEDRDRLNAMLEDDTVIEGVGAEALDGGAQVIEVSAEGEAILVEQVETVVEQSEEASPVEQAEGVVVQEEVASVEQAAEPNTVGEDGVSQEDDTNEDLPEDALPGYTDDDDDEEDETMVAEMAILEEVENDVVAIEQYGREMSMIADSIVAIESFGINPSAVAILQTTGLLSDTVLEAVGVESLGYAGPKDDQTMIALEALEAKGNDKAASWSAKILSMAKSVGSKIMSVLGGIWEKITGAVKAIGGYTWDKAKVAGAVVKAHPYKTIMAVVVAIAAVAGITVFISGGLPALMASTKAGAAYDKYVKFGETVASKVNAIKWPFGKVAAEAAEKTGKLTLEVATSGAAPEAMTLAKTGWTQTVVKGVESSLGRAWAGIKTSAETLGASAAKAGASTTGAVKDFTGAGVSAFTKTNAAAGGILKKRGSMFSVKGAGSHLGVLAAATFVAGTIKFVYGLVFKVVAFGLRVIYNTMKAIAGAVKGSSTAAA